MHQELVIVRFVKKSGLSRQSQELLGVHFIVNTKIFL